MTGYTKNVIEEYYKDLDRLEPELALKENLREGILEQEEGSLEEYIERIRKDFVCSAAFFLIKNIIERDIEEKEFNIQCGDKIYNFHTVTIDELKDLPKKVAENYIEVLLYYVKQYDSELLLEEWHKLLEKIFFAEETGETLSREEALKVAHGLKFSYNMTQAFLLRVLEDDGLVFNSGNDIIEAFCFIYTPSNSGLKAAYLKKLYYSETKNIVKIEMNEKLENGTKNIKDSLSGLIEEWKVNIIPAKKFNIEDEDFLLDAVESQFMEWMIEKAPYLDIPSKSAYNIYQKIIKVIDRYMTQDKNQIEEDTTLLDRIYDEIDALDDDMETYNEDEAKIIVNRVIEYIISKMDEVVPQQHKAKVLDYLKVKQDKSKEFLSVRAIDILLKRKTVKKADLMFVVWLCCNMLRTEKDSIHDLFESFYSLSEDVLEEGNLPDFYAPHLLETTFLRTLCPNNIYYRELNAFQLYEQLMNNEDEEDDDENKLKRNNIYAEKSLVNEQRNARNRLARKARDIQDLEGLEEILKEHFLSNYLDKGAYKFERDGIYYEKQHGQAFKVTPVKICDYQQERTKKRFDDTRIDFINEEVFLERKKFLIATGNYLKRVLIENSNYRCNFRTTCKKTLKSDGMYIAVEKQSFRERYLAGTDCAIFNDYIKHTECRKYEFYLNGVYSDGVLICSYDNKDIFNTKSATYVIKKDVRIKILKETKAYLNERLRKIYPDYNLKISIDAGVKREIHKSTLEINRIRCTMEE